MEGFDMYSMEYKRILKSKPQKLFINPVISIAVKFSLCSSEYTVPAIYLFY